MAYKQSKSRERPPHTAAYKAAVASSKAAKKTAELIDRELQWLPADGYDECYRLSRRLMSGERPPREWIATAKQHVLTWMQLHGLSLSKACQMAGINAWYASRWRRDDEDFAAAVCACYESQQLRLYDSAIARIESLIDDADSDSVRLQAAVKAAENSAIGKSLGWTREAPPTAVTKIDVQIAYVSPVSPPQIAIEQR